MMCHFFLPSHCMSIMMYITLLREVINWLPNYQSINYCNLSIRFLNRLYHSADFMRRMTKKKFADFNQLICSTEFDSTTEFERGQVRTNYTLKFCILISNCFYDNPAYKPKTWHLKKGTKPTIKAT